jgi:putative inorganic carbon (HCO3(-)) transporter
MVLVWSISSALSRLAGLVDRWHWAFLIVATPFLLFPSPRTAPALLILPVVWIAGLVARRVPLPRTPLNLALLLLVVMLLVSEWATFDLLFSLPKITGVILGIAAFFAIVRVGGTSSGWWLSLLAFLGAGVFISGFGLIGTAWGAKIAALSFFAERLVLRVRGIPGIEEGLNPNQLAGALTWVAPGLAVLAGFVMVNRRVLLARYGRRGWAAVSGTVLASTLFVLFVFVLTESRSAYMGFAAAMGLVAWAVASRRWRRLLVAVSLTSLVVMAILLWQGALGGLGDSLLGGEVVDSSALSLSTVQGRLEVWSRAIFGIQDFPFTGMGMNAFRRVVPVLYPLFTVAPSVDIAHAHNEHLQAALDLGIPGLISFLALEIVTTVMLVQIWLGAGKRLAEAEAGKGDSALTGALRLTRALALALGSGFLAHTVFGLTDASALGSKPGILFWMLLGLAASLFLRMDSGEPTGYPSPGEWRRHLGGRTP